MASEDQIIFGPFRLEVPQGRLWRGDEVIPLRPRSLALLHYLATHPGRLVTKAEVQQHVWAGAHVTLNVQRVCVREIRAALAGCTGRRRPACCANSPRRSVEIYGWFTEGFDTADLQEAKALLAELGG